jgi:hypothetical protein
VGVESLEDLRMMYARFSVHSRCYLKYDGPLYKGAELGNYQVVQAFPGLESGVQPPAEITKLLRQGSTDGRYVGAYPPAP